MSRKLVSFDWAMKKILRQKDNFDILEGFLSELFRFDVKIVEILESEANQESENDKFNRVDLLAKDNRDELILIEVQYDSQQDYFHRMLYGASKLICEYMEKGEDYEKVKKVYSVNIVYFALAKGKDYPIMGKTIFYGPNEPDEIFGTLNTFKKSSLEIRGVFLQIFPRKISEFKGIRFNGEKPKIDYMGGKFFPKKLGGLKRFKGKGFKSPENLGIGNPLVRGGSL